MMSKTAFYMFLLMELRKIRANLAAVIERRDRH